VIWGTSSPKTSTSHVNSSADWPQKWRVTEISQSHVTLVPPVRPTFPTDLWFTFVIDNCECCRALVGDLVTIDIQVVPGPQQNAFCFKPGELDAAGGAETLQWPVKRCPANSLEDAGWLEDPTGFGDDYITPPVQSSDTGKLLQAGVSAELIAYELILWPSHN
jgi:hypothetical protein